MNPQKLRFYRLEKQNLIQQAPAEKTLQLINDHIALHATDFLTPFFSLWARIQNFDTKLLFDQLNQAKNIVKARAFRGTIFLMHQENYMATRGAAEIFLATQFKEFKKRIERIEPEWKTLEKKIIALLTGKQSLTINQIKKQLSVDLKGELRQLIFSYLEFNGTLIRTGQRYLIDPVNLYGLAEEWLPQISSSKIDSEAALAEIMKKYIRLFGPVCLEDICWWFPISKTVARKIQQLSDLQLLNVELNGKEYFWEQADYEQFLKFNPRQTDTTIINFLPYEDHFPKAYKIRGWYISAETTPQVFNVGKIDWGQLRPSIWVNGEIVGRWELEFTDQTKTAIKIKIVDLNKIVVSQPRTKKMIEEKRIELQKFSNEKLVPLMAKK